MKTPSVKGLFAAAAAVLLAVAATAEVRIDRVQQRYPWNGIVDIDYTVSGEEIEVLNPAYDRFAFQVIDKSTEQHVTNTASALSPAVLPTAVGSHRVSWDANADGLTFCSSNVTVQLVILHRKPRYMVVDISGGSTASTFPITYYEGEPAGDGFNTDEYKGNKIAFALIPAGTFWMGSPTDEPGRNTAEGQGLETRHLVTLTKPYYMAIFPITQQQYVKVTGVVNPSEYGGSDNIYHPVERVTRSSGVSTFLTALRAKTGKSAFALPTEAQWERACRAATDTPIYDGVAYDNIDGLDAALVDYACYNKKYNNIHTKVGTFKPNFYGLYDMLGNVWEWCLDSFNANKNRDLGSAAVTDPCYTEQSPTYYVTRGRGSTSPAGDCRSARRNRSSAISSGATYTNGMRICLPLP